MKKCYETVISKHHDYTNKIAAEVCGKIAVSPENVHMVCKEFSLCPAEIPLHLQGR